MKINGTYLLIAVGGNSSTNKIAGAIAGVIRSHGKCEIQAIGARATNQAVKAVVAAQSFLLDRNAPQNQGRVWNIAMLPSFVEVTIPDIQNGGDRLVTGIRFVIWETDVPAPTTTKGLVKVKAVT